MNESGRTARASALERSLRASALDRALRRAAVRECERHAPGLRDAVLEAIRAPERAQVRRFTTWKLAASVAALFTLAALGVFAARIVRDESAATAARDARDATAVREESAATAARDVWDGTAARGMGRDPELAVPRALPHAASVANSSRGVVPAIAGPVGAPRPASRDLLARTLPESRALDTALRGELAELGRDTLALARFVFESARLGPPPSGS